SSSSPLKVATPLTAWTVTPVGVTAPRKLPKGLLGPIARVTEPLNVVSVGPVLVPTLAVTVTPKGVPALTEAGGSGTKTSNSGVAPTLNAGEVVPSPSALASRVKEPAPLKVSWKLATPKWAFTVTVLKVTPAGPLPRFTVTGRLKPVATF